MFNTPSFRIGKIFGIPFEVHLSWIVIFGLVSFGLATSYYPDVAGAAGAPVWVLGALGLVTALLFFASILAHELCHALVTRLEGGQVDKITLFIFGGVAQISEEPRSPGKELLMAAAGPSMSLVIGAVCMVAGAQLQGVAPWWVSSPLQYLGPVNIFIGLFNLLPGFPLDGGRVLRSILWALTGNMDRATRWAARSGQVIGWGLAVLGLGVVLMGYPDGLWFGLVGWFIAWLAGSSYRQQEIQSRLSGITVERVMTPHPEYVDGDMTVEALVRDHMLGRQHSRYPVISEGAIIGVVTLDDVKRVAQTDWPFARVADITDRDLGTLSVDASTPAFKVLPRLAQGRTSALLVVRDGRLAGIITRSDVVDVLNQTPMG